MAKEKEEKVLEEEKDATTSVTIRIPQSEVDVLDEWQELMSLPSRTETIRFFIFLGELVAETMANEPMTAERFAAGLYTVGTRFWQAEFRDLASRVEDFKRWQELKSSPAVTFSPTKRLTMR